MDMVFRLVCSMSAAGAVTALAVLLIRLVMRHRVKSIWFLLLWGVVFFRFLTPFSVSSSLSVLNALPFATSNELGALFTSSLEINWGSQQTSAAGRTVSQTYESANGEAERMPGIRHSWRNQAPPAVISMEGNTAIEEEARAAALEIAKRVWLSGMCISLLALLFLYALAARGTRRFLEEITDKRILAAAAEISRMLQLRQPLLLRTGPDAASPFAAGIISPLNVLPESLLQDGEQERLAYILAHEIIHIRRRDNLKRFLSLAVLCVHWFNPMAWAACVCFQRDMELSCDETVISAFGERTKKAYASSLYQFALGKGREKMRLFAFFGESGTKSRVKNVLRYRKSSRAALLLAVVLTVSLCGGFATNPAKGDLDGSIRVAYTGNDGLYLIESSEKSMSWKNSEGQENFQAEKVVEGQGLTRPTCSQDGELIAFLQGDTLYAYRLSDQVLNRLAGGVISFCPGEKDRFYVSTKDQGITSVGLDQKSQTILAPEQTADGWTQYEQLLLSPDGSSLAFTKQWYVEKRSDSNRSDYEQNQGVYLLAVGDGTGGQKQIQHGGKTVSEALETDSIYGIAHPGNGRRIPASCSFGRTSCPLPCMQMGSAALCTTERRSS